MTHIEEYCPKDQQAWRDWLEANHVKKEAVWLLLHRKKSPKHNLSWSESVDEALCFGWIDSTKRTVDEETYKQYFTKRKPTSNWSKINKAKVQTLIDQGLMREAGLKSIEVAKENGSWTLLDKIEALVIPDDLREALANAPAAETYFEELSNSAKKILLYWLSSAKRSETRHKRLTEIVDNAQNGMKPTQFR